MAENKPEITWRRLLPEFAAVLLTAAGVTGVCLLRHVSVDKTVGSTVLSVIGAAILGMHLRQSYLNRELDYDNAKHYLRFWVCYLIGLAGSLACAFLPSGGWPYQAVFVMLSLFGNMSTGILAGSVLLAVSVLVSGAGAEIFLLYFLSGLFAVTLFRRLEDNFKIGIRLFLSLFCLLLCETAGIVLPANERPDLESFVIPISNIVISGILLLGLLKLFSSLVIYQYRERYLELNDTENEMLSEYRNTCREEYMHSIHTAYFCERIADRLSLREEALKCAGYYHKLGETHPEILEEQKFPPQVQRILTEYFAYVGSKQKKPVLDKETAVLVCSETVMHMIQYLLSKSQDKALNYDYIIDSVFKHFYETETFLQCNITLGELKIMQDIFKEEKLYYDFLR